MPLDKWGKVWYNYRMNTTNNLDLRILVWSNPLTVDKIGKTFHYWKDSGFIFTKHLLESMPVNYRFYWVIPDKLKGKDVSWFEEANNNIELIYYPYSTSIHQNRYEFYGDVLKKNFPYTKDIDVIINNQPEVSANLKVWAQNQRRDNPIILSFFHWIDCSASRKFGTELGGYSSRQHDGSMVSDMNYFHSEYAIDLFLEQQNKEFKNVVPREKCSIFNPPPTKFGDEPFDLGTDKKIILFNHRLNATTGWKQVLKTLDKIYEDRQDFVLWITDDSKIQKSKELESREYIINKRILPLNYGFLMSNAHFGICNHRGYSTWNMALLDAFFNGCFMIAPYSEEDQCYINMFGRFSYLLYHNTDTPIELENRIKFFLNCDKGTIDIGWSWVYRNAPALKNSGNREKITELIESLIRSRVPEKTPAKYEEVLEFIPNSPYAPNVSKRDIVNKFWSFHVNSNFQKIRWKLLLEGVKDNTDSSEPSYYRELIE